MEKISNYNTDGTMLRKQQERMFEMLCVIDDICVKNEINYWLSGGTLLGAVRHGGFIPWDDDLDIQLMKDDYNKLLGLLKTELPEQYQLQTSKTDRNYFARYAKVRDVNSLLEDSDYTLGYKYKGIFIDIFSVEKANKFLVKISAFMQWYLLISLLPMVHKKTKMQLNLFSLWNKFLGTFYSGFRLFGKLFAKKINYSYGVYYPLNCDYTTIFPLTTIEFEDVCLKFQEIIIYIYVIYMVII